MPQPMLHILTKRSTYVLHTYNLRKKINIFKRMSCTHLAFCTKITCQNTDGFHKQKLKEKKKKTVRLIEMKLCKKSRLQLVLRGKKVLIIERRYIKDF